MAAPDVARVDVATYTVASHHAGTRVEALLDAVLGFLPDRTATETKGSWWPDWIAWIKDRGAEEVPADGARIPGEGALPALADAPGDYVRQR